MEHNIIYVGLDVHKDTIAVALAVGSDRSEVRNHGKIANTPAADAGFAVPRAAGDLKIVLSRLTGAPET